jgi:heme-binding NEAT domain protein
VTEPEETLPEESATEPSSEATEPTETTDATDATQDSDPTDPEPTGSQQPTQTPPADNGSAVPQLNTTDKIVIAIGLVAVALLPGVVSFLVVSKLRGRSRR